MKTIRCFVQAFHNLSTTTATFFIQSVWLKVVWLILSKSKQSPVDSKEVLISKTFVCYPPQAQLALRDHAVPRIWNCYQTDASEPHAKREKTEAKEEQPTAEAAVESAETTDNETEAVVEQNVEPENAEPAANTDAIAEETNTDVAPETENAEQTASPEAMSEAEVEPEAEAEAVALEAEPESEAMPESEPEVAPDANRKSSIK